MTDWTRDAACAGMPPRFWFPDKGDNASKAKRICASCPVRPRCYLEALTNHETEGIWGGVNFSRHSRRPRRKAAHV
jgi:WhiB family redox-sensing transcriptional regulator